MQKIVAVRGINPTIISKDRFDFFNKWYIPAIRELLFIYDFRGDYASLAKQLDPAIKSSEAEEAVRVLSSLNFIHKNAHGRYLPTSEVIRKDPNFKTLHWANLMRAKIGLARKAIERYPKDERDISEVYAPLSEEGYLEIKEDIAKLRKKMLALSERDKGKGRDRVWQCNVQLFPISKRVQGSCKSQADPSGRGSTP